MKNAVLRIIIALGLAGTLCWADSSASFRTTSLGDGWFEYQLHLQYNAFFDVFDRLSCNFNFEGFQEFGSTDGADVATASDSHVTAEWLGAQPRNVDRVITVRSESSLIGYTDFYFSFLAVPSGWSGGGIVSENIAGYIRFRGLAPCLPDDPDLLGTTTYTNVVMVPDPQITACTTDSLTWNWSSGATMRIEASQDLMGWSLVTQLVNSSTVNTWISPVPLDAYGNAFRVNLVSNKFSPSVGFLGRNSRRTVTAKEIVPSAIEPQVDGQIVIRFSSQPGGTYQVCIWDAEAQLLARKNVTAADFQSTAQVFDRGLPGVHWITIDSLTP